jgi:hypothetical protein
MNLQTENLMAFSDAPIVAPVVIHQSFVRDEQFQSKSSAIKDAPLMLAEATRVASTIKTYQ